ncbi:MULTISPECIES: hypothetical protein [Deinococcus]|uniref:Uncharacterized protein n=2 Tax=Deinococcus soli (ex Cha et al. 2016) TaxID=1309411 RepID=A0ACC6KEF6_9DEIO|nr:MULTISPECIES: hypothetical protein [Deinococcus]MDK2013928.1 hypothetical protein [Deinococcus sp. 43]MDR6217748.1 hypothetical protein [Deinococcus soli (ex Cha et al. 2016)]MDR6327998.1 hypothetical protein [Deinococcus soli (ex Cha et al. 2016)]MDR6750850.1 hypothetical protein [Deinococcus soli (ex Cha et al. 2016)]GGB78366.1 hypothetical protein GCM10008019_38290 [Deinococcus soli (ex Cha et al. 2016)]
MLTPVQLQVLSWINLGSLIERTSVTGRDMDAETCVAGTLVTEHDLETLERRELMELLSSWRVGPVEYRRYGLTGFGLSVLHAHQGLAP